MMQYIRERAQGWLALVLVGIIALIFTVWGLEGFFGTSHQDVVASVDGHQITRRDVDMAYERLARLRRPSSPEEVDQLKQIAIDRLINLHILQEATEEIGIYIGDAQVQQAIMSSPDFQENGIFSKERYMEALRGALLSDRDVRTEVRHMMSLDQLQKGIINSAFVVDPDLKSLVAFVNQKRDIGYFVIPKERFESAVVIKEDMARSYYDEHQKRFIQPEQVKVSYVELSLAAIASKLSLSEKQIEDFYQEHPAMFSKEERVRASHILLPLGPSATEEEEMAVFDKIRAIEDKLAMGTPFEELAAEYSADPISAKAGGDLEWFGRGQMISAFEDVAFSLDIGEISEPVRTEYGYHIIKKTDYHAQERQAFSTVRDQVEAKLRNMLAEEKLYEALEEVSTLAFEYPTSLASIAEALDLPIYESEYFAKGSGQGIFSHPSVMSAAFSPEVKNEGFNSELIQVHPETYIVLRHADGKPERQQTFEEVQEDIVAALTEVQSIELTRGLSRDLKAELISGKMPDVLASERLLSWETLDAIERSDDRLPPALIEIAFSIPRQIDETPKAVSVRLPNGDYVTMLLRGIENGDISEVEPERMDALVEGLSSTFGQADYQLLISESLKKRNIKVDGLD